MLVAQYGRLDVDVAVLLLLLLPCVCTAATGEGLSESFAGSAPSGSCLVTLDCQLQNHDPPPPWNELLSSTDGMSLRDTLWYCTADAVEIGQPPYEDPESGSSSFGPLYQSYFVDPADGTVELSCEARLLLVDESFVHLSRPRELSTSARTLAASFPVDAPISSDGRPGELWLELSEGRILTCIPDTY